MTKGPAAMTKPRKTAETEWAAAFALMLAETGVRNSRLEELHQGVSPGSAVGDYSDVKVVTPYGEIPWRQVSRLDDDEMKELMIEVVDRLFTILCHPEPFTRLMGAARWNAPQLDPSMMESLARWKARQAGMPEAEVQATFPLTEAHRRAPIRSDHRAVADQIEEADEAAPPDAEQDERRRSPEITPEAMRALAQAPIADLAWIAKACEALAQGADGWERTQLETLKAIDVHPCGQD
ncbi:hypothetical protein [Caulobacter hibisci]|uniref:Uncharacterized protein n=1 Tax=Caulobacter hibisci TaxID=2035993 RepID=A0ABS0T4I6_9CAUL|nr:hypothetical protein [Caulobacter hibisci]MBI1686800.1 hypothetical protein [Caulobacter hibisci]